MDVNIQTDWKEVIETCLQPYIQNILCVTKEVYVLPPRDNIFRAFSFFDIRDLKVVIIGQDPYHTVFMNEPLADGLCFSVNPQCKKVPPSLRTIFKELEYETKMPLRQNADLSDWAKQGVLLFNTALTVKTGKAGSHMKAWRPFTNDLIGYITQNTTNVVYILWGEHAKSFKGLINTNENLVLECRHPSGLAASKGPFIGNNHFSLTNVYLRQCGKEEIKWL